MAANDKKRCFWGDKVPEIMVRYHDEEWGVPVHDDDRLFQMLCLEGFQAGLSFLIVLRKREALKKRFHGFSIDACAGMTDEELEEALADAAIIRNRKKVYAVRQNARAAREAIKETGSFDRLLWRFVGGSPLVHRFRSLEELPATSPESDAMSRELKKRGFSFVGSTICYAFMQAVGMVNDHTTECFRWGELGGKTSPESSVKSKE